MFKIKAGEDLLLREREILRLISVFLERDLKFIVVGGYAIATFRYRFSVDIDLVIPEKEFKKFESVLMENGYSHSYSKDIKLIYGEKFERFEKKINNLPVNVDLLINGIVSRSTDATWSFNYIIKESVKRSFGEMEFRVPSKELLIAMKIHSGRFGDIRDIVALIENSDTKTIKKHASRGDRNKLKKLVNDGINFLENRNFIDGFKGIFGAKFYKKESVEKTLNLLKSINYDNGR
ncbi:MAG: nucleotidyltransferase [Candidatus Aenigmarchaeota archaeon]|nr:nucleotidyltransferase [Candidatus Aenigmarchaeota archaeon]